MIWLALLLVLAAGCSSLQHVRRPDGTLVVVPKCVPVIQYQGRSFTIKGLTIPIPQVGTTVQVGEVVWDVHTLQTAAVVSQLIDLQRMSACAQLPVWASSVVSQSDYEAKLTHLFDQETQLAQLAIIVQANDPASVQRWIDAYARTVSVTASRDRSTSVVPLSVLLAKPSE